jgi:uncharacterized protein YggT (Ycf19 family)
MSIARLVATFLQLYGWVLVAYVVLGWFVMADRGGGLFGIYRTLAAICEPYLGLFRRLLPPIMLGGGGLDLSPLVGLIVLQIVAGIVGRLG